MYLNYNNDQNELKLQNLKLANDNNRIDRIGILAASTIDLTNYEAIITMSNDMCPRYIGEDLLTKQLESTFQSFKFYKDTGIISMSPNDFSDLVVNLSEHCHQAVQTTEISSEMLENQMIKFLTEKKVRLQPTGLAGVINRGGNILEASGSAFHTYYTVASSHLSGLTGVKLITASPLLVITVPTVGGLFFVASSRVFHGTIVGEICSVTGSTLFLPLRVVEIAANNLLIQPISSAIGHPTALNMTQAMINGLGFDPAQYPNLYIYAKKVGKVVNNKGVRKTIIEQVKKWLT